MPIAHAGGAALGDPDQARLLEALERFANREAVDADLLRQQPFRGHGVAGDEDPTEDLLTESLMDGRRGEGELGREGGVAGTCQFYSGGGPAVTRVLPQPS